MHDIAYRVFSWVIYVWLLGALSLYVVKSLATNAKLYYQEYKHTHFIPDDEGEDEDQGEDV